MTFRKYMALVLAFVLLMSGVTVAINYIVDPYLIFGSKRIHGFNAIKAAINTHTWQVKTYQPSFGQWDTLLVGNSRVEIGLNPQHRCLLGSSASAYNLGVPGADMREQLEFAANVIYQQPIKEIILNVDFSDFITQQDRTHPELSSVSVNSSKLRYRIDGSENPDFRWNSIRERYKALFSLDALSGSLLTIAMQRKTSPDRDEYGFNPAQDFAASVDAEGARALFEQKIDNLHEKFSKPWGLFDLDGSPSAAFLSLEALLDIARTHGIRVIVVASPFHAKYWAILSEHGLLSEHDRWLEILTERLAHYNDIATFWDFTSDMAFSNETIPDFSDRSGPLNWYWEPVHFRSELGDLILETVLAERCEGASVRFGSRVQ